MLKNYLKIAFRSLRKNELHTVINILGLSVGIAASILIFIFVAHEFSFDRFHQNGERIYRAEKIFSRDGRHSLYANPEFGPAIKTLDPHVLNYVRLYEPGRKVVKADDNRRFFEDRFIFSDTSYFSIFSFELIKGDRASLTQPNTVIVTEATAAKYFDTSDIIGKTIIYNKIYSFEIVGIAKNPPSNSSLQFDFIGSFSSLLQMPAERDMILNNSSGFPTYLLLRKSEDLASVNQSILKTSYSNEHVRYSLAPFFENHFNPNFGETANTRYVFIFLCVAILILALALINYMNLTTARATTRAKEVGVRKVIGANKKTLSFQFYIESTLATSVGFVLAFVLIELVRPFFINVLQLSVDNSFLTSPLVMVLVASLWLACMIIAGSYPALILSRFKPVDVLKGKFSDVGQGAWIKKTLIAFQFCVLSGLIICTLVMQHQLNFLRSKPIGFDREQVMVVPIDALAPNSYQALKMEVGQQAGVLGVATASMPLFKNSMTGVSLVQSPVSNEKIGAKWIIVDNNFPDVLGISWSQKPETSLLAGNHLINVTAAQAFGVGRPTGFDLSMGDSHSGVMNGKIVGLVEDFNYQTLRSKIEPLIMTVISDTTSHIPDEATLYIRLSPDSRIAEKISTIKNIYAKYSSETPLTYYFLDDAFDELQKGEERLSKIFKVFTFIAIGIAGLGLFGLIAFTAERRRKEISIRKVLGASLVNILSVLSGELLVLVMIGFLVGAPIAWFVMKEWLSAFFYQAGIPLSFIFLSGATAMILAVAIISMYGIKAALSNPTKHLSAD